MRNLSEARISRGWTQAQVADQIGTTTMSIHRWESGENTPNPHFRRALTNLFGMSEEQLGLSEVSPLVPQEQSSPPALYDSSIPLLPTTPLVGREGDLARVKEQLCQSDVVLTAFNGLPGVGKTSLAIALAHDPEMRDYFRDGVLWAGLGPAPNIAGLLSRWARLFGLSETHFTSLDEDQKRTQLRRAIGTRSLLIVLDDVWKLDEALALRVGGPNCASLATTRFPAIAAELAGKGAMRIEELNEEQGIELLRILVPGVVDREPEKARLLVHAVGGLPLALTLFGKFLRKQAYSGPARRITAAMERLSEVSERFQISEPLIQSEAHPSIKSDGSLSLESIIEVTDRFLGPFRE